MRLFSYRLNGAHRLGVLVNSGGVDVDALEHAARADSDEKFVAALAHQPTTCTRMVDLLSSGRARLDALDAAVARLAALSDVPLLPDEETLFALPTTGAQKFLCVGRNYLEHIAESRRDVPADPVLFCRYEDSLVAHKEAIERPVYSNELDWEGELAVIIGSRCRYVSEADALDYVAGYSVFNDGSVRDYQHRAVQWTPGKNFVRSGSYGPYLVTSDEIPEPQDLELETRVDNAVVQKSSTETMIFSVRRLIAYISEWTELNPGDVIATGTPAGIGSARTPKWFLEPGNVLSISISGVGTLRNPIVDAERPQSESVDSRPAFKSSLR